MVTLVVTRPKGPVFSMVALPARREHKEHQLGLSLDTGSLSTCRECACACVAERPSTPSPCSPGAGPGVTVTLPPRGPVTETAHSKEVNMRLQGLWIRWRALITHAHLNPLTWAIHERQQLARACNEQQQSRAQRLNDHCEIERMATSLSARCPQLRCAANSRIGFMLHC